MSTDVLVESVDTNAPAAGTVRVLAKTDGDGIRFGVMFSDGTFHALAKSGDADVVGSDQPLDSDLTAIAAATTTAFGISLLTPADAPAARALLLAEPLRLTVVDEATTARTLALADELRFIRATSADPTTITIPTFATIAFPLGACVRGAQFGAGQVTIAAAGGVTLRATPGALTRAQYSDWMLRKVDTNEWLLTGDLAA